MTIAAPPGKPRRVNPSARQPRILGLVITALAAAVAWFLIGTMSDLDKASRRLELQEKQERGEKFNADEQAEWQRERVGSLPLRAVEVATRPRRAALIGAAFVGIWGMFCWGLSIVANPRMRYSWSKLAVAIGLLVGAPIGGAGGLVGGALACLFLVSVGLAVFGLFFGCAHWCVALTGSIPKNWS